MLKQYFSNQTKRTKQITSVLIVIIVAAAGTYFLVGSHAATPYASITAGKGTLSSGAISKTCSGASSGSCVVFGSTSRTPSSAVLGVNDGDGWGPPTAATLVNAGIKWDRIEFDMPSMSADQQSVATNASEGFSTVAILDVASDSTKLSTVNPTDYANWGLSVIKANPSIKLWEVGNEMYYKGCPPPSTSQDCADPVSYGKMYLDLYYAVKNSGVSGETLMFNMWGDYYNNTTGSWSQDANGGGWLHDAVAANPGLATAIASEALSSHPYGGITDYGQEEIGPHALAGYNGDNAGSACPSGCSQEAIAKDYLGTIPPIYVTEYGIQVSQAGTSSAPGSDSGYNTPCSTQEGGQAYLLTEAYNIFLKDPHVKGVFWYQTEDDGTGQGPEQWGLLNSDDSARPSFKAFTNELDLQQHTPSCTPS